MGEREDEAEMLSPAWVPSSVKRLGKLLTSCSGPSKSRALPCPLLSLQVIEHDEDPSAASRTLGATS